MHNAGYDEGQGHLILDCGGAEASRMDMLRDGLIVTPEQGPVWEMEAGRPTTFKLSSEETGDRVAVFEEVVPVGSGTPLHIHHTSDEVIHILAGEFTFTIGARETTASAGTWVFIARGVAHAWVNSGEAAGRAFYLFVPAEGAKVFEALRLLQVPVTAIDPEMFTQIGLRYGYEMVGPGYLKPPS
jgi:quercetin dioxygenase-like cupin family protein